MLSNSFSAHKILYTYKTLLLVLFLLFLGSAKLGYTALALCDNGPYLVCASSIPDHTPSHYGKMHVLQ